MYIQFSNQRPSDRETGSPRLATYSQGQLKRSNNFLRIDLAQYQKLIYHLFFPWPQIATAVNLDNFSYFTMVYELEASRPSFKFGFAQIYFALGSLFLCMLCGSASCVCKRHLCWISQSPTALGYASHFICISAGGEVYRNWLYFKQLCKVVWKVWPF